MLTSDGVALVAALAYGKINAKRSS